MIILNIFTTVKMSFKSFIGRNAIANLRDLDIFKSFYTEVIPGNTINIRMFEDWLFELNYIDKSSWDQAHESNDIAGLNEIIINFEDNIIENFARMCSDNLVIIEDDDICEKFRAEICNLYVFIFSEYIEDVFRDFQSTTVRVYQEIYEEEDEGVSN